MVRRALLALAAVAAVAWIAGPAAAQYPPGPNETTVDPPTVEPGDTVTVRAWCFVGAVRFELVHPDGQRSDLGSVLADEDGVATLEVTVPADLPPGSYTIEAIGAVCDDGAAVLGAVLEVGQLEQGPPLAFTGGEPFPLVRAGVLLVAAGGVLLAAVATHRRYRAA